MQTKAESISLTHKVRVKLPARPSPARQLDRRCSGSLNVDDRQRSGEVTECNTTVLPAFPETMTCGCWLRDVKPKPGYILSFLCRFSECRCAAFRCRHAVGWLWGTPWRKPWWCEDSFQSAVQSIGYRMGRCLTDLSVAVSCHCVSSRLHVLTPPSEDVWERCEEAARWEDCASDLILSIKPEFTKLLQFVFKGSTSLWHYVNFTSAASLQIL